MEVTAIRTMSAAAMTDHRQNLLLNCIFTKELVLSSGFTLGRQLYYSFRLIDFKSCKVLLQYLERL